MTMIPRYNSLRLRRVLHCHQFCIPSCHHSAFRGCLAFECELAVNTRPPTRHKTRNIYRCRASTTPSTNTSSGALRTWPHVGQCGRPVAIHDPQSTRRAARARPGSWVLALDLALDRAVRGEGQLRFCEKRQLHGQLPPSHAPSAHFPFSQRSAHLNRHTPRRTDGVVSFTCVLSVDMNLEHISQDFAALLIIRGRRLHGRAHPTARRQRRHRWCPPACPDRAAPSA